MTTPGDAADLCRTYFTPWHSTGEFATGEVLQNDEYYLVTYGNAEWIEGRNPRYLLLDQPLFLVRKVTGVPSVVSRAGNEDLLSTFRAV